MKEKILHAIKKRQRTKINKKPTKNKNLIHNKKFSSTTSFKIEQKSHLQQKNDKEQEKLKHSPAPYSCKHPIQLSLFSTNVHFCSKERERRETFSTENNLNPLFDWSVPLFATISALAIQFPVFDQKEKRRRVCVILLPALFSFD
jgi:hypothetical protein